MKFIWAASKYSTNGRPWGTVNMRDSFQQCAVNLYKWNAHHTLKWVGWTPFFGSLNGTHHPSRIIAEVGGIFGPYWMKIYTLHSLDLTHFGGPRENCVSSKVHHVESLSSENYVRCKSGRGKMRYIADGPLCRRWKISSVNLSMIRVICALNPSAGLSG